ncbi:hypothetical protein CR513_10930, partial [Mucuna pruriens]
MDRASNGTKCLKGPECSKKRMKKKVTVMDPRVHHLVYKMAKSKASSISLYTPFSIPTTP